MNFKCWLISLLSLVAVSCVKEIAVVQERDDWDIVMNASLTAGKNTHFIYLSKAWSMRTAGLHDAVVKARLGDEVFEAEEIKGREDARSVSAVYALDMPLQPGETVTLTAASEGKTASATVTAPPPGNLSNLRSLRLIKNVWFTADLADPGEGEDFFQLSADVHFLVKTESGYRGYTYPLDIDVRLDAVLSDGNPQPVGDDSFEVDLVGALNDDGRVLFSDRQFQDGKASVRFSADVDDFRNDSGDPEAEISAIVRLTTYSKEHYRYLKAVATTDMLDTPELLMFIEPVTIPCNVKGGLGFVGARSFCEAEVIVTP